MSRRRVCLPLAAWPEPDRKAWIAAITTGSVLRPGGPAERWRPATRRHVMDSYGYFLFWLRSLDILCEKAVPADRLTPDHLAGYIEHLKNADLAPATVENRLVGLDRAFFAMAPEADRMLLRRAINRLHDPHAGIARKRTRIRDSGELFALGFELMRQAEDPDKSFLRPILRPILYRDGLIISFLAARPLRRRNFAGLLLGKHLHKIAGEWWIIIPAEETKTKRRIEVPFPEALIDPLQRYLDVHRPALIQTTDRNIIWAAHSSPLWISTRTGGGLSPHTMNLRVCEHTQRAFGRPVNMHLFRDCAATSIAIRDAKHVRIAATILGHRSFSTTERHYNLARSLEAASDYHQLLEQIRREA